MTARVVFFAPPGVTALDLIGPLQVFQLVGPSAGGPYRIEVCALTKTVPVAGNLHFSNLLPYGKVRLGAGDTLFVSGSHADQFTPKFMKANRPLFAWIRRAWQAGATICSVCTGSYLLAEAGVLDGLACATHWGDVDDLQKRYPKIEVRRGVLFVESGNVLTSAGIASGIDLAIHLIGQRHGQKFAFEMARLLVVYLRRSGEFAQESVYLKYRNHLDDLVHRAQSILLENLETPLNVDGLAEQAGASPRNLSRRFRQSLGLSIGEYLRELRLERARSLLEETGTKVEDVAKACGFSGSRQLRNLYRERFNRSPRSRRTIANGKIAVAGTRRP
jgi:transcriptional regulator GlxA family with amidase domain